MVKGLLTYTYPMYRMQNQSKTISFKWMVRSVLLCSRNQPNSAEFTLLGATWNNQKSAQEYFSAGVEASVRGYDFVAGQDHIPYYDAPYNKDPHDVSIKLQEEWVSALLQKHAYKLTGDKKADLEKVYVQQYLHYFNAPIDQYVNMLRSGVPQQNSSVLPRLDFDAQLGDAYAIPRRFPGFRAIRIRPAVQHYHRSLQSSRLYIQRNKL